MHVHHGHGHEALERAPWRAARLIISLCINTTSVTLTCTILYIDIDTDCGACSLGATTAKGYSEVSRELKIKRALPRAAVNTCVERLGVPRWNRWLPHSHGRMWTTVARQGLPDTNRTRRQPSACVGLRGHRTTRCAAAHSTASTTSHASSTNSSLLSLRFSSSKAPSTILRPGGHRVGAGAASSVG